MWYAAAGYKAGRPYTYSDVAMETVLTIQAYLRLPLRAMQGFIEAWFAQSGLDLKCPDYTTLCRRRKSLNIRLRHTPAQGPLHLVIDGTGLKISGEGEWKRRIHGTDGKRRGWRKLHLALDRFSHQVVAKVLTDKDIHDSEVFEELMRQAAASGRPIKSVKADGAYDTAGCYKAAHAHKAVLTTPPRRGATVQCPHIITRDQKIFYIHGAVHLFDTGTELEKYTWVNTDKRLIEQAREALSNNLFPLFVAEGKSASKLQKIKHQPYLHHCYKSFLKEIKEGKRKSDSKKSLFVFGHSLADTDKHIFDKIGKGTISSLFISIYGDQFTEDNQRIIKKAQNLKALRDQHPLDIYFYSAESAQVWGQP
ncbi:MAG: IS5 family transposase [Holosporales bacterium]